MARQNDVKILLVEDEEAHAELVKMNLARSGFTNEIMHFDNGLKAVDFLLGNASPPPERYLILLDVNMPGLDGRQVLQRIKSDDRTRRTPVIMLTTTEDEREIEKCYALGCNLYLTKPMDYENFCSTVHELGLFYPERQISKIGVLPSSRGGRENLNLPFSWQDLMFLLLGLIPYYPPKNYHQKTKPPPVEFRRRHVKTPLG